MDVAPDPLPPTFLRCLLPMILSAPLNQEYDAVLPLGSPRRSLNTDALSSLPIYSTLLPFL